MIAPSILNPNDGTRSDPTVEALSVCARESNSSLPGFLRAFLSMACVRTPPRGRPTERTGLTGGRLIGFVRSASAFFFESRSGGKDRSLEIVRRNGMVGVAGQSLTGCQYVPLGCTSSVLRRLVVRLTASRGGRLQRFSPFNFHHDASDDFSDVFHGLCVLIGAFALNTEGLTKNV